MYTLQEPTEFLEEFIAAINHAEKHVRVESMLFVSGIQTRRLAEALKRAAQRGVIVDVYIDWITQFVINGEYAFFPIFDHKKRTALANSKALLASLTRAGIHVAITNTPHTFGKLFPFAGRNHTKLYMIDNRLAWIGGVNLADTFFEMVDFLIKTDNEALIAALNSRCHEKKISTANKNQTLRVDKNTSLLLDAGKPGKSIIYKLGLELIDNAQKTVFFISQFVPGPALLHHMLQKTKSNVRITIVTSSKSHFFFKKFPYVLPYYFFLKSIKGNPHITFIHLPKATHAKLLLVDGTSALFGSHNLAETGVWLGTEELDLITEDQHLINQLNLFITSCLS